MTTDSDPKRRFFHPTPGHLLVLLLAVEVILFLSKPWIPKGWAVLFAVATVGMFVIGMSLWYVVALLFHWRFQFSIRSLLVLTVAVAIPASWLTVEMKRAKVQMKAVAALKELGCKVYYEHAWESVEQLAVRGAIPPGPSWLRPWMQKILDDDFFLTIMIVDFTPVQTHDSDMELLEGIRDVKTIYLNAAQISDAALTHLEGLKQLKYLYLSQTGITDAGCEHLRGLNHLIVLELDGTQITDAGLENLEGLTQLQLLNLRATNVTEAGIAKLRQALPLCRIEY